MLDDVKIIRELARSVVEIAHSDQMQITKNMWRRHNSLEKVERPPVMCRPCGAWEREFLPPEVFVSTDPLFRGIEAILRMRLFKAAHVQDDEVVEPWIDMPAVHLGEERPLMWGVNVNTINPKKNGGSFIFKPEIMAEEDIDKLRVPEWRVNEAATSERYERACELLDGILDVHISYGRLNGAGFAYWGSYLRGLEQMMYDCVDRPEWFHRFIKFICDAHIKHIKGLEADNHIVRNDVGSVDAACMTCNELPRPDFNKAHVRLIDTWGAGDSQEFALVSPQMWEEFILDHQIPIFELYGLISYGCCESLVGKIEILRKKVANLRRVTVSPWSDIAHTAGHCRKEVVMEIRPMPSDVLAVFDKDDMRKDIESKMKQAGDTIYDFCLQDIETVFGRLETLSTWTAIAKEVGEKLYNR
ncbi:MAG: hypothetical protein KAQ69_12645 [Spirochaetales bacterium]|nr:hypothetical protein [Spirochaetales bacterium]